MREHRISHELHTVCMMQPPVNVRGLITSYLLAKIHMQGVFVIAEVYICDPNPPAELSLGAAVRVRKQRKKSKNGSRPAVQQVYASLSSLPAAWS